MDYGEGYDGPIDMKRDIQTTGSDRRVPLWLVLSSFEDVCIGGLSCVMTGEMI